MASKTYQCNHKDYTHKGVIDMVCQSCGDNYTRPSCWPKEQKLCSRSCQGKYLSENYSNEKSPNWKNGLTSNGYVRKQIGGVRKMMHRVVMEQALGRELQSHENVHHINGDRSDNSIENLELWSTSQPRGQRVSDKIEWAIKFLKEYEIEVKENRK